MIDPIKNPSAGNAAVVSSDLRQAGGNSEKIEGCLAVRPGQVCPICSQGTMDYDGLLILSCASCGYREPGGGYT